MSIEPRVQVRVSRRFESLPEHVFDAWLEPDQASRWLFATQGGRMVRVEIAPRVGGSFVLVDRREGEDVEHCGEYLEIVRPSRLAFTLRVPKYSNASTQVIIDIAPLRTGCELTLTHEGVLPEFVYRTREGWTGLLERLGAVLQSEDEGH